MDLSQGSIVWVDGVVDEGGKNPKKRGMILLTADAQILSSEFLHFVCITGEFTKPIPPDVVKLSYSNGSRHPRTGLSKESVAVCRWIQKMPRTAVPEPTGHCPQNQLNQILLIVSRLRLAHG